MMGFRVAAVQNEGQLPLIDNSLDELETVQWFSRSFVQNRLQGGSTALQYVPSEAESLFHLPGPASLARKLITEWCLEDGP